MTHKLLMGVKWEAGMGYVITEFLNGYVIGSRHCLY
jgi:hypothetical protein